MHDDGRYERFLIVFVRERERFFCCVVVLFDFVLVCGRTQYFLVCGIRIILLLGTPKGVIFFFATRFWRSSWCARAQSTVGVRALCLHFAQASLRE